MTKLLEEAIDKVSKLPDDLQEQIAEKMLKYYNDLKWDELLAHPKSEILLEKMKKEAIKEIEAGETLDTDEFFENHEIKDNQKLYKTSEQTTGRSTKTG